MRNLQVTSASHAQNIQHPGILRGATSKQNTNTQEDWLLRTQRKQSKYEKILPLESVKINKTETWIDR